MVFDYNRSVYAALMGLGAIASNKHFANFAKFALLATPLMTGKVYLL